MLPDWVSNPGPLTYESGALPIAGSFRINENNKVHYFITIRARVYLLMNIIYFLFIYDTARLDGTSKRLNKGLSKCQVF